MKTGIRMHQRTTSLAARVLLALAGTFGGFVLAPATAQADNYVTSSTRTLSGGTWIVEGTVTVSNQIRVGSSASVTLRLNEGATLNAEQGISVSDDSTLTIEGAGTLNATGSNGNAGIGGAGTVVINGGTINASGSERVFGNSKKYAAAIGSRIVNTGGSVTINGGQVSATGVDGGAGIGGDGWTVTLGWTEASDFIETTGFQGTVGFAEGKQFFYADTDEIVTSLNLRGGRLLPLRPSCDIVVADAENGNVTADKSNALPGSTVTLTASSSYPYVLDSLTVVTATGISVDVERIDWTTCRFVMPDEDVIATPIFADKGRTIVVADAENGSVTADKSNAVPGDTVTLTANSAYPWELDSLTVVSATGAPVAVERIDRTTCRFEMPDENVTVTPGFAELSPVELMTSEGIRSCLPVVPYQPSFDASFLEWFAVTNDVTLPERLNVAGHVKLYLCEGATLTCEKGLRVVAGNGLTIEGEGALVARTYAPASWEDFSSAIGSDGHANESCGDITIRSGTITATGGTYGAAIGAGYVGNGGSVTIRGGKVTAIGGSHSPGIGSSYNAYVATTVITLGWTEEDDFIECSAYNGDVSFMDGKVFLRADNRQVATAANISGVRIIPRLGGAHDVVLNSTGDGVLLASDLSAVKDELVTLSWTTTNRYIIPTTLTVKDGGENDIDVEWTSPAFASFVMPDDDVTVAAAFGDVGHVSVTTSDGVVRDCRPITPHLGFGDYEAGNYAVTEDTTIGERVVIGGDVMLYLCEGVTLTCGKGITVNDGSSLTVEGGGSLIADASGYEDSYAAGIGGGHRGDDAGTITVNGGSVTAVGDYQGAGIGGGSRGSGGTITVNGGAVNASGGWYGAGIGGGSDGSGGMITINGGQVTATGGLAAAGIGDGSIGEGGIVILGWTDEKDFIHASSYAGSVAFKPDTYFVLQGTGELATLGNIGGNTIVPFTGGTYAITENPGEYASIDAVYADGADPALRTTEAPEGGTVHVRCSILDAYYYEREITGLTVTGSGGEAVAATALGGGVFRFAMPAGNVTLNPLASEIVYHDIYLTGDAHGGFNTYKRDFNDSGWHYVERLGTDPLQAREGDTVHLRVSAQCPYYSYGITVTTGNGENVAVTKHSDIEYEFEMPTADVTATVQTAEIETVVKNTSEGEQTCLVPRDSINDWTRYAQTKGLYWFAPTEDTTIPYPVLVESNLHVRLYLTEGTTLVCGNIHVEAGSTLTIEGEGTLIADATGGVFGEVFHEAWYSSGIGGGGNIIIKSGNITATGRSEGAGIGGASSQGGGGTGGYSGDVTISGGTVTACGGEGGAGIGSAFRENCGVITISGGIVNAVGGVFGAGIGGGYAAHGDIRISGGVVNATGGYEGAGIGGGSLGTGGKIAISGGVVTAQGGGAENYPLSYGYGAGIGEGSYAAPDNGESTLIRITGGQVTARGGRQSGFFGNGLETFFSAGIGLGWRSRVGECDIRLGWTEESDYVDSDRYYGEVSFVGGKFFKLDGTDTQATPDNINGVRIVPVLPSLAFLEGDGTGDAPWLIRSARDWNILCSALLGGENTSNKLFRQTADISVTNTLGTAEYPFAGTFDGGGNTLTVAIESAQGCTAPFSEIDGATISNLVVVGTVSGGNHSAGLVGACGTNGLNTIRDCTVSASVSGAAFLGGIVGHGRAGELRMERCVFDGSVSGFTKFAGGLMGWCDALTLDIRDCLVKGTFSPGAGGLFHPIACKDPVKTVSATAESAYYLNTLEPTATGGNLIPGADGTPASAAYVPGEWRYPFTAPDGNVYYLADSGTVSPPDWDGVIRSDADWDLFAALLDSGTDSFEGRTVRLAADIGVSNPAGTADHAFAGIFDGGGHTLTVAIADNDNPFAAPFSRIDGATISNLVVGGTVSSSQNHAAGLVGGCGVTAPNAIRDCVVSVAVDGAPYAGGIVGHGGQGELTLEGCVFDGFVSGFTQFAGGLMGWCDALALDIRDCLVTGAFTPGAGGQYHPIACKFANRDVAATVANAYYLRTLVPTATGGNLVPGAEGTPVSATFVDREWTRAVTAADGLTYYRQPSSSYAEWAAENGISGAWDEKDADGIANVFRYVFDVTEGTDGMRILDLTFNDQGQVVVQTPPVVNSNGFGLSIATADDPAGTQNPTSHPLDSDGETVIDEPDTGSRTRFYRLKAAPGARYARSDE